MSDVIIQLSNGMPLQIEVDHWKIIASATHVVLRENHFMGDRLVVRHNAEDGLIVCAELKAPDGRTLTYGEQLNRPAGILSTMLSITKRFKLPPWVIDKCLLELRNSAELRRHSDARQSTGR